MDWDWRKEVNLFFTVFVKRFLLAGLYSMIYAGVATLLLFRMPYEEAHLPYFVVLRILWLVWLLVDWVLLMRRTVLQSDDEGFDQERR